MHTNSQSNVNCESKNEIKKSQGGFIAVLHSLEKQFYGPEVTQLSGAAIQVLLYLRHRALRDHTTRKQIPKKEIMEATGLKPTTLKTALRQLEKKEFILVIRTKVGKAWSDNTYELHPKRFGTDYVYRPKKPSFRVIYGSKGHKSKKESTASSKLSTNVSHKNELGSHTAPQLGSHTDLELGLDTDPGKGIKKLESFRNYPSKNPLKNPLIRTLSENSKNWIEGEDLEERKRLLKKQMEQIEEEEKRRLSS